MTEFTTDLPDDRVPVTVTFRSHTGRSVFDDLAGLSPDTVSDYLALAEWRAATEDALARQGFTTESRSRAGLTISAPRDHLERTFGVPVRTERLRLIRHSEYQVFAAESPVEVPDWLPHVERVDLPKQLFVLAPEPSADPPVLDYPHLLLPDGIEQVGLADRLGPRGTRGRGVDIVIVDTGLYRHPHLERYGYDVDVVPAIAGMDCSRDERGHGTGMSAILLSVAPATRLTMVKAATARFSWAVAGLQRAVSLRPRVINLSWGTIGLEPQAHLEIASALESGIFVVAASGNGSSDRNGAMFQSLACPGMVSVGGCWPNPDGPLQVSDISSSFDSEVYPGRHCPDVCGPCGMLPHAQLVLLPTEPGCIFDRSNGQRDGTEPDDGWFVSSGTSGAAAYVSGMLAASFSDPTAAVEVPAAIRAGSVPVRAGRDFMGVSATGSPGDPATGAGYLRGDALAAWLGR